MQKRQVHTILRDCEPGGLLLIELKDSMRGRYLATLVDEFEGTGTITVSPIDSDSTRIEVLNSGALTHLEVVDQRRAWIFAARYVRICDIAGASIKV